MTVPLSRNRDYRLLWISQALSGAGFSASMIAFPLLVLAVTGSPAMTGLVLGVEATAQVLVGVPGGALVDRWNRKKLMLIAEATQALAVASLVFALWLDVPSVLHMVVVAALMGVCNALFGPAESASLVRIVPQEQLSRALAMNSARGSVGQLSGTALGGFLFAVGRLVPFAFNVLTHTISFVALLFVRVPHSDIEQEPGSHLGGEMVEGLRWVWRQRHVRVTVLCAVSLNFFFSAYYIVIIVLVAGRGVSPGEIGVMAAMLGVGGILGALLAPYLHRVVSPYTSIIGVFWALAALTPLAVFIDSGLLMGALFFAMALLPPTANTTINTYQLLLTPDRLRGRLSGVMGMISGVSAAAGPAFGGLLVQAVSGTRAVLLIAAAIAVIAVITTLSPTMRSFPRDETVATDASEAETTKGR
ncbi:MFS transporter [Lentzea terrae]|uniref:MFS transporter n=1 Tax=Lentzea terrae TaxID=2200761 RepID=UPI000DD3C579|nr:MFS transporter [Lentzea terrae]